MLHDAGAIIGIIIGVALLLLLIILIIAIIVIFRKRQVTEFIGIIGRPFVKWSAACYQTVVCLSALSCPICVVGVLMDQDETWHAGMPRSCPHCVRWGRSSPSRKGAQPPIFGSYLLRPNRFMDQDVTWYGARPRPRRLCVRWGPSPPSPPPCVVQQ